MLRNTSNEKLTLMWAGISTALNPKDTCDVSVIYKVHDKDLLALEDRFVSKFKGAIEKFIPEVKTPEIAQPKPKEEEKPPIKQGRPKKR